MLATIEIGTIATESCSVCRRHHEVRVALAPERDGEEQLLGFFARCPATGERSWVVLRAPMAADGRSALLAMGPLDALDWEPAEDVVERPLCAVASEPRARVPFRSDLPLRSERLRQALGCPHGVAAPIPA
jgi:hypothetical protein